MASTPEYCLFAFEHWAACMSKAEWSGWVQAFGSIAAIVGAFLIVSRQNAAARQLEEKRRQQAETYRLKAFLGVVRAIEATARFSQEAIKKRKPIEDPGTESMSDLGQALRTFVPKDLPAKAGPVSALVRLPTLLDRLSLQRHRWLEEIAMGQTETAEARRGEVLTTLSTVLLMCVRARGVGGAAAVAANGQDDDE